MLLVRLHPISLYSVNVQWQRYILFYSILYYSILLYYYSMYYFGWQDMLHVQNTCYMYIFLKVSSVSKFCRFTGVQNTFPIRISMTEWRFQKLDIDLSQLPYYQQLKPLYISYRAKDSTPQKWCTWNSCLSQSIRRYGSFRGRFLFLMVENWLRFIEIVYMQFWSNTNVMKDIF